jgi:hypothetical protein
LRRPILSNNTFVASEEENEEEEEEEELCTFVFPKNKINMTDLHVL